MKVAYDKIVGCALNRNFWLNGTIFLMDNYYKKNLKLVS